MRIEHEIAIIIFLQGEHKWAFYNNDKLLLPTQLFITDETTSHIAQEYVKRIINKDVRIKNIGFSESIENEAHLFSYGYLVEIEPGTNIDSQLEFMTYEQVRDAIHRISQNHFKLLRKSIGHLSNIPIFTR
jgi:hypothetical protein